MTVGDAIARWLYEKGVTHAYGITGAGDLPTWDAIARGGKIQLVCTHHEQAAAFAAAYQNRTVGRLQAVVICTTGGGSTNPITGVLAAQMDSIPLLVLSGNEPLNTLEAYTRVLGVQGYDSSKAAEPFTKCAVRMKKWKPKLLELAWEFATKGRRGVVWIDIPRDVSASSV